MSSKNSNDYLLRGIFKRYVIQVIAITAAVFFATVFISICLRQWLNGHDPFNYLYYRDLYLLYPALAIWVLSIVLATYRLFKQLVHYVDELQEATNLLFDKEAGAIELSPELAAIAEKINALKAESIRNETLAAQRQKQKNDLIVNLAHDLKTPLASIVGYLNLLNGDVKLSGEEREKYLDVVLRKSEALSDLIDEFFEMTKFNLADMKLHVAECNLSLLLEQIIFEFKPLFDEKHMACEPHVPGNVSLWCDADKMSRVFGNLLKNAYLYGDEGSTVVIEVTQDEEIMTMDFINACKTIPEEALENIFEPFYRLDPSRHSAGGSGLGLAISREILRAHGAEIAAESADDKVRFRIRFKK
ncbi:sensor histidine kinase [Aedoeadaptatus coli]|uniref:sensor histidine kinase n=1 Tax=Aedoeadaptatus coli TaxID=2058292 RepID=UPI000D560F3C|nr:HAMP domain-containing sensor histidine kinase [Peptoniphilus coli]